jgi:ribosomal protein L7/L12
MTSTEYPDSNQHYKRALQIMQKGIYDMKAVCLKLAQEHPDKFCLYVESDLDPFIAKIINYAKSNQKIQAIKDYREKTGLGLCESKFAVEKIWKENGVE